MRLDVTPPWRRTVMALAFTASAVALTVMIGAVIGIVWLGDWPASLAELRLTILGNTNYGLLGLLALVLGGLAMTVSLRSASARFLTGELTMTGGDDAPAEEPKP